MSKRRTHKEFLQELKKIGNDKITILEEYKSVSTKLKCKCNVCGNVWETTPQVLLKGHGCRKCATKRNAEKIQLTHNEFIELFSKCNNPYVKIVGKYAGTDSNIECECLICGESFYTSPYRILNGAKHITCAKKIAAEKRKCDYEELRQRIHKVNPNIELLGEYINFHTKMKFKCICGEIHEATPDHLLRGGLCYKCGRHKSKGEDSVEDILQSIGVTYKKQYKPILENNRLAFDFALMRNGNVYALIEYDGEGHYIPIDFAGKGKEWANKNFETYQLRDSIKDQYCKDNNIPLLRIPYWDYNNIDKILSDFLETLKQTA